MEKFLECYGGVYGGPLVSSGGDTEMGVIAWKVNEEISRDSLFFNSVRGSL